MLEMNLRHDNWIGNVFTGYAMILEGKKSFSDNFSWLSTADLSVNFCRGKVDDDNLHAGKYVSSWISTGIQAQTDISATGKITLACQIGVLFLNIPDKVYDNPYSYYHTSDYYHTDFTWATSYNVSAGVNLAGTEITIRYYYARPEFTYKADTRYGWRVMTPKYTMGLIQLTAGVVL
jgi:hypothetical protein